MEFAVEWLLQIDALTAVALQPGASLPIPLLDIIIVIVITLLLCIIVIIVITLLLRIIILLIICQFRFGHRFPFAGSERGSRSAYVAHNTIDQGGRS